MGNVGLSSKIKAAMVAVATAFVVACSGNAFAQGFDLGQLFGGGGGGNGGGYGNGGGGYSSGGGGGGPLSGLLGGVGGGRRHQNAQQNDASGISVDRSAAPFTGKFSGKQDEQGAESTITAQFACYPASDADIPGARAFVCYTGGSGAGGPPPAGGPGAYVPPPNSPPFGAARGGPPPDIE